MCLRNLKAIFGVKLPVVCILCCIILGGCATEAGLDEEDAVAIAPRYVSLNIGGEPDLVTATWIQGKSPATFDRWIIPANGKGYTLSPESLTKPQIKIFIEPSSEPPELSDMHASEGFVTSDVPITAVIKRGGADVEIPGSFSVSLHVPHLRTDVTGFNRRRINPQTSEVMASIVVYVSNTQAEYDLNLSFGPGVVYVCDSAGKCNTGAYAGAPTISGKPGGPVKSAIFTVRQTVQVQPPDLIGDILWHLTAIGTSANGSQIKSRVLKLQF